MVDVVLVGTVHRDPEGQDKLLSILHEEDPVYITLEMSPYAVRFRRRKRLVLRNRVCCILGDLVREGLALTSRDPLSHPAVRNVLSAVDFPYEYMAVSLFSRSNHVPFRCIDRSDFSKKKISRLERELISRENLQTLIGLNPHEIYRQIKQQYTLAFMALGRGQNAVYRPQNGRTMSKRDRFMAWKIREVLDSTPCHKLVHVGGWEHLIDYGSQETLFTLLSDLHPQRRLLDCRH